jgi:glycosidase
MKRLTSLCATVLLLASLSFAEPHTFTYAPPADAPAKSVSVAGTFNNWSTTADPLKRNPDGTFATTLDLPEGVHHYKFVLNGGDWTPDPKNSDKELEVPDGYGRHNSAVLVGPDARKAPPAKPNHINTQLVVFRPNDPTDLNVYAPGRARVRVRVQAGDVDGVTVVPSPYVQGHRLSRVSTERGLDVYGGAIPFSGPNPGLFLLTKDGDQLVKLDAAGTESNPTTATPRSEKPFPIPTAPTFETPDWTKDAVWYQIFPERFRNGDPANDPPHTQRWQSKWFSTLPNEAPGDENFYAGKGNVWQRRYGGDVQGLTQSLPYLKSLGVTAIYLNPVFEAESLHKYDTTDYRHIDDNFGVKGDLADVSTETDDPATWQWTKSDRLFLDFVDKAHAMGFKVVLDGVFNHVGRDHWAFQDVLKKGKQSKYADWFDVRDWNPPIKYIAWDKGNEPTTDGALPIFRKDPKLGLVTGPREHVLAIARRWLAPDGEASKGIDGWRLDVATDVPHPFWVDFRKLVKQTKPDAYICGEIWTPAQPWLKGDEFDAVMNYPFAMATQAFFVNQKDAITPSVFNSRLNALVYAYPLQVSLAQMNLLDSHDTDRFASMFVNPDLVYDAGNRIQDNGPKYNPAQPDAQQLRRMKQALVTQFTFLGAPMIYYGDEAGMWSPDDPSNRQPMVWKDLQPFDDPAVRFNDDLFKHYQKLIAIRHTFPALRTGFYRPVLTDDARGIFAYARELGGDRVYVAINRSDKQQTLTWDADPSDKALRNYLSPDDGSVGYPHPDRPADRMLALPSPQGQVITPAGGRLSLTLPPYGAAILSSAPARPTER